MKYEIRISETLRSSSEGLNSANIVIEWQAGSGKNEGTWSSVHASTITHTGSGKWFLSESKQDMTLTELGFRDKDGVETPEEVMYLVFLPHWPMMVGDTGKGQQRAQPCRQGKCIRPGKTSWECVEKRS